MHGKKQIKCWLGTFIGMRMGSLTCNRNQLLYMHCQPYSFWNVDRNFDSILILLHCIDSWAPLSWDVPVISSQIIHQTSDVPRCPWINTHPWLQKDTLLRRTLSHCQQSELSNLMDKFFSRLHQCMLVHYIFTGKPRYVCSKDIVINTTDISFCIIQDRFTSFRQVNSSLLFLLFFCMCFPRGVME